jgi:hypothetical protein
MGKKSDKEGNKKKLKKEKKPKEALKKSQKAKLKSEPISITPTQRIEMIATAAYYIAERHGFKPERADEDWREAERQIEAEMHKHQATHPVE